MEFIINKTLTKKLKNIKEIGVDLETGSIMAIYKDNSLQPLSQEIFELVVVKMLPKENQKPLVKTKVECFDREYVITCEQVIY